MDAEMAVPRFRRPGVFVSTAAITVGVSIVTLGPSDQDAVKSDAALPHATRSMDYVLLTDDDPWAPDPEPAPPPPAAPPPQPVYNPPPPRQYVPPPAPPPPPPRQYVPPPAPPPPPPQVTLRFDSPITSAFVSMANVPDGSTVGCRMTVVPIAGIASSVGYTQPDWNFTLVGSQEKVLPAGSSMGPATGSTFRNTVTCDNGTSVTVDEVY